MKASEMTRPLVAGWKATVLAALALGVMIVPTAHAADATLVINGKAAPADVRPLGGTAYVRLADVAAALGLTVVKRGSTYELTKAGGANQIEGVTQGKIGDTLFDGRWRFQVLSMQTVPSYTLTADASPYGADNVSDYNTATRALTPKPGHTLVMLRCRVSNGQKSPQTLWIARNDTNTALADAQGESYPPILYDVDGAPIQTKPLLPGSKLEFPVFFSVPTGTDIKALVFTLHNNSSSEKPNDVRVSLKSP